MNTIPLEKDTRTLINRNLENLGWELRGNHKNVYFGQPRTKAEKKKLEGKRLDYILYSKKQPLIIIETKKKGQLLDTALEQGISYARKLNAPLVFATDGVFCKSYHTWWNTIPKLNDEDVDEFLREVTALRFLEGWEVSTFSKEVKDSRKELIQIFDEANNMLRGDGLRAGIERFSEFANILFLKLISESKDKKEGNILYNSNDIYWNDIKNQKVKDRIEYVNGIVYRKLNNLYGEIFTPLTMRNNDILSEIIDKLDPLNLIDINSDVKGNAFEYFLKESTSTKNDLGEYFTPRHIIKAMVRLIDPKIDEKVYDPFCGTGGFLIESFRYIHNNMYRSKKNMEILQKKTLYGNEITNTARIAKMNMILAGDGHTNINMKDSLEHPIHGQYDVVITNMPYSQKTKHGDLYDLHSTNGDSICVQHCIKAINGLSKDGRIALIVPEGFLFRKDLSKVREYILEHCQLQSIVSLPQGVFLPYTAVKTNIIYATKVNQKLKSKDKRKDYWYFDVKSDGYTLDNHRRKLNTSSDLTKYEEYCRLDNDSNKEIRKKMLQMGFEVIPLGKVRENSFTLVGSRYREQKIIPSTYEIVNLGSIVKIINGYSFPLDLQGKNASIPFYKVSDMNKNGNEIQMTLSNNYVDDSLVQSKKWSLAPEGTIVFPKIGAAISTNKKRILSTASLFDNNIMGLMCDKKIYPKFLLYLLKNINILEWASLSNPPSISKETVLNFKIPLPPLEIQQEIVDEIESYQRIVDGAVVVVDNYKPIIQTMDNWIKTKLDTIVDELKAGFACGDYNKSENGVLHIRPMNITNKGTLTLESSKYIDNENIAQRESYLLNKGDILFNNTNSKELVGKTCYIEQNINALYSNHITRIRINLQRANPKFIALLLHNMWGRGYFMEHCKKWIGQAGFDLTELSKLELLLPSIEVQNSIVKQI